MLALAESGPSMVTRDAIWTFCNALLGCETDQLKEFFDKYQDDLIYVLCDKLRPIANDHVGLLPEVMAVFHKLLMLDEQYPDELIGPDSVKTAIEGCSGFEIVE